MKELKRQQELYDETRTKITKQVDKLKLLLEKFRKER